MPTIRKIMTSLKKEKSLDNLPEKHWKHLESVIETFLPNVEKYLDQKINLTEIVRMKYLFLNSISNDYLALDIASKQLLTEADRLATQGLIALLSSYTYIGSEEEELEALRREDVSEYWTVRQFLENMPKATFFMT